MSLNSPPNPSLGLHNFDGARRFKTPGLQGIARQAAAALMLVMLGVILSACQPEGADCAADDECLEGQICADSGGLLFSGGVCVWRSEAHLPDTGADTTPDAGDDIEDSGGEPTPDVDPGCQPKSCNELGNACGSFDDGCGRLIRCGSPKCVASVGAGESHTCAALGDGGVFCWGDNQGGQLGIGGFDNSTTPTPISDTNAQFQASQVSAGYQHSCAMDPQGSMWCWGANEIRGSHDCFGQLGTGDDCSRLPRTNRPAIPVNQSAVDRDIVSLKTHRNLNCGINDSGAVFCWGDGSYGQVGDQSGLAVNLKPVKVEGLRAEAYGLGLSRCYACAAGADGLSCWGDFEDGCDGEGRHEPAALLFEVDFDKHACQPQSECVAGGQGHTCFIDKDKKVFCFNQNTYGQLGTSTSTPASSDPVEVSGLGGGARQVAAGDHFSCALVAGGDVYCWGRNDKGQLGDGSTKDRSSPVKIALNAPARLITLGARHGCAVLEAGGLQCWGDNASGQLGNGESGANLVETSPIGLPEF